MTTEESKPPERIYLDLNDVEVAERFATKVHDEETEYILASHVAEIERKAAMLEQTLNTRAEREVEMLAEVQRDLAVKMLDAAEGVQGGAHNNGTLIIINKADALVALKRVLEEEGIELEDKQ